MSNYVCLAGYRPRRAIFGAEFRDRRTSIGADAVDWIKDKLGLGQPDSTMAYTDRATVTLVQQAIVDYVKKVGTSAPAELDLGGGGPRRDGVDGDYGPRTRAAVSYVNTAYGADPSAGPYITDKTLERLSSAVGYMLVPAASPMKVSLKSADPPPASAPGGAQLQTPPASGGGLAPWQVGLAAGLGGVGLLAVLVGLLRRS